ncbi:hypothetical protein SDC9_208068 [bioreactor metagenome]|uniref:Uncharacterized protein n=1 Tax=bioreactor metagenome TaxID=1076179 RepID=A0A645JB09_9ZZZZ
MLEHGLAQPRFLYGRIVDHPGSRDAQAGEKHDVRADALDHSLGMMPHQAEGVIDHRAAGAQSLDVHLAQFQRGFDAVGDHDQVVGRPQIWDERKGGGGRI